MTTRLEVRLKRMELAVGPTDMDYWSRQPVEEWPTRVLVFFLIGCPVTDEQAWGLLEHPVYKAWTAALELDANIPFADCCQRHGTTIRNVLAESMDNHRARCQVQ